MKVKSSRCIVIKLICCAAMVVLASAVALSQTPKSGALLTIDGTGASSGVHVKLYDSQIHSGVVQAVPSCTAANQVPTDAYVLQGGSATGCDPGDAFEVTDDNPNNTPHQASGLITNFNSSGFRIETHYKSEPIVHITDASQVGTNTTYTYTVTIGPDVQAGETIVVTGIETTTPNVDNGTFTITAGGGGTFTVANESGESAGGQNGSGTVSNAVCNTAKTICANPDSGFLTVTNNTGSAFSGTISLTGISPTAGDPFCPASLTEDGPGVASDTWALGLTTSGTGRSVTLALGSQGTTAAPKAADSSNCGGFNQPQLLTLSPNVTSIAKFGKDDYQITPLSASGDVLSVLPVPVPAGPLGSVTFTGFPNGFFGSEIPFFSPLRFKADNFELACVPYADFSAGPVDAVPGNPVCVELQISCSNNNSDCTDAGTFFYTVQNDYNIDANSLPGGIGGPAFIGKHGVSCPDTTFNLNIFTSYTAPSVTFGDPLKGGGSGTGSCWVAAFDPNATAVSTGSTVSTFVGLQSPVQKPPKFTLVKQGAAVPLTWQQFTSSGSPVTTLSLCPTVNNPDGTCNTQPPQPPVSPPWVSIGTIPVSCSNGVPSAGATETSAAGGSTLQNFLNGTYRFSLKTPKNAIALTVTGCEAVIFQFDGGVFLVTADIKFTK